MFDKRQTTFGQGLFGAESIAETEVYLNTTPLLDVMSNILFFLLAAFGVSAIAVISVSVPVDSLPKDVAARTDKEVFVVVRADVGGMSLSCQSSEQDAQSLAHCNRRLPKNGNTYDLKALHANLIEIKAMFSKSNTLILVPNDDLPFEKMVHILDAARGMEQALNDLPLYPNVILSHLEG